MSQHILQGKNPKFNVFSFFLDEVTPKILSLFKKAEGQDYYLSSFTKTNHLIIHSWAWLRSCERVTINHRPVEIPKTPKIYSATDMEDIVNRYLYFFQLRSLTPSLTLSPYSTSHSLRSGSVLIRSRPSSTRSSIQ